MTEYLTKCLFIVLIVLSLIVFICSTHGSTFNQAEDSEDPEYKQIYQPVDKSDWIDSGDMFTYDPSSGTNRESKFKEAASMVIQMAKERRKTQQDSKDHCFNDCQEIIVKLKDCEESQKKVRCECLNNDHCGARSYQIIRRLMILLNKQLTNEYSRGSILELKVNLDDFFFQMPENIKNISDCDYLANLHPLADQILPSIIIYHPDPLISPEYLSVKFGATGLGCLLTLIWLFKMAWKIRLLALISIFFFITLIWEYLLLYQTEMAKVEEKSNRLKDKCESQASINFFGWISSLVPVLSFGSENSECTDYYISTRVNPLLSVNPIMAFSKLYEHTILFALTLTANATGLSFKAFFSHIPTFWVPIFLLAGVTVTIFYCKYSFKYRSKARKSKPPKPKSSVRVPKIIGQPSTKGLPSPPPRRETKAKKLSIDVPISRYGSTGDILKLFD